jgi:lauroyl/myristoyl acyltransferase
MTHRFPLWHYAGRATALAFRAVPERFRYPLAVRLAKTLQPVMSRTTAHRERLRSGVESSFDVVLDFVLAMLTRNGTTFTPTLRLIGFEHLDRARANGSGVLAACAHSMLNAFLLRALYDRGERATIIATIPWIIPGTRETNDTIVNSPSFMVGIQRRLRAGDVVAAMIDRDDPDERRTERHALGGGEIYIANALIPVGLASGAEVVFLDSRAREDGTIVVTIGAPSDEARTSAEAITTELVAFLEARLAERTAGLT